MNKKVQRMEELIERSIDSVTANPTFLMAVATLINANSYRKIWMRNSFEAIWRDLELPVRQEQEKISSQIEDLKVRIKKLELELGQKSPQSLIKEASSAQKKTLKNRLESKELEFQ